MYLADDIKRIAEAISQVSFNQRNQDFIVETCCQLHEYYDEFATLLISAILRHYRDPQSAQGPAASTFNL